MRGCIERSGQMDHNSLKKLASLMGEEFKVIDSVTLENINLQRLITKEKEYCASLEVLINANDNEIEHIENETRRLKCKLEEVTNNGILLKTSLESLKSSHKMVELLKIDLMKQLHLEMVKSSEQNMKFDSTIKKYEVMWESYKSTYQKFPLVADLHKSELKLKQKSIQLAIQEKSIRDYEDKIIVFSEIQDKREKVAVLKIAEKYLQREKLTQENDILEKNIRLKEENLKLEIEDESRNPSFGILKSSNKTKKCSSKSLSYAMDGLMDESNKENIFTSPNVSAFSSPKTSYQRYEALLTKRVQSVPLLKLPPLSLLDSPPRKVRSVGNLLSPPKTEWSKENSNEPAVKHVYDADINQWNGSALDVRPHEMLSFGTENAEVQNDEICGVDNPDIRISSTNESFEHMENKIVSDDLQPKMECEMKMFNRDIDPKEKEMEIMVVHNEETGGTSKTAEDLCLPTQCNESKPKSPLDSIEFSYVPRTETGCPKMAEPLTEEMKSPYFASSYLNFMEVPKKLENITEKVNVQRADLDKDETIVIDLTDETQQESTEKENYESEMQNIYAKNETESDNIHILNKEQEAFSTQSSEMEVDNENMPVNDTPINHDAEEKPYERTNYKNEDQTMMHNLSGYPSSSDGNNSYQFDISQENQNASFGTPMELSQMSVDSEEYAETSFVSMSPEASRIQSPFLQSPPMNNHDHGNIFGSPPQFQSFNYKFSGLPQQSSASALFGNSTPTNNEGKERKPSEVFNFSFDSKRNTSTMFKLF